MTHFTPIPALLGGLSIGLSAALLWIGLGRIAGFSGIVAGVLGVDRGFPLRCRGGRSAGRLLLGAGLGIAAAGEPMTVLFVVAMATGMAGYGLWDRRSTYAPGSGKNTSGPAR